MLASGTDLGPLMGVPVAIKDLFAVNGMPTTAGSRVDVSKWSVRGKLCEPAPPRRLRNIG